MGKNWFIVLAACMVVMSIIIGSINQVGGHDEIVSGIAGNKAYAQELNPDRTMALIAKGGITNDSVMEQSIVSQTASIAGTQQIRVWVTAYTSDPLETDDTPNITALGTETREGIAAANFLPFGTKFMIPEVYGNRVFVIEDRMNARFNDQRIVDIWFNDKTEAIKFGKQVFTINLL